MWSIGLLLGFPLSLRAEAPPVATLCWSLDRPGVKQILLRKVKGKQDKGNRFHPPASCQSLPRIGLSSSCEVVCWCSSQSPSWLKAPFRRAQEMALLGSEVALQHNWSHLNWPPPGLLGQCQAAFTTWQGMAVPQGLSELEGKKELVVLGKNREA